MEKQQEWETAFKLMMQRVCSDTKGRMNQLLEPRYVSACYEEKTVTMAYDITEWELNPRGELHGGAIAAMFDLGLGIAARCSCEADQIATTDMAISYLRRVEGDDTVLMTVRVIKSGRQMIRLSGEAVSGKTGKAVAVAQCSYMVISM